jgi:hypothetical protein
LDSAITIIGSYSGTREEDVTKYVSHLERETRLFSNQTQLLALRRTVTGRAKDWLNDQAIEDEKENRIPTLADWIRRLKKKYDSEPHARMVAESRCKQGIHESAADYVLRKLPLIKAAYPHADDKTKIRFLEAGVHPKFVRYLNSRFLYVMSGSKSDDLFKSFEDVLDEAMEKCDLHEGIGTRDRIPESSFATGEAGKSQANEFPMEQVVTQVVQTMCAMGMQFPPQESVHIGGNTNFQRNPFWTHPKIERPIGADECFNCLSKEHQIRDCPKPRRAGLAVRAESGGRRDYEFEMTGSGNRNPIPGNGNAMDGNGIAVSRDGSRIPAGGFWGGAPPQGNH